MTQSAFMLRIAPSRIDRVPVALATDRILIGWSNARGLLDPTLAWFGFREIIRQAYYATEPTLHKAGGAAGHMWRFLRDMKGGDLVVVPYGPSFLIGEVTGEAIYNDLEIADDTAYQRPVEWLNGKQAIPRSLARSALISRMKMQGTCADASDILAEIRECLTYSSEVAPTFQSDLQARLVRETLNELRSGRMESFGFERLIQSVLLSLGASDVRIVPRSVDKGADLVATYRVAGAFRITVAVQAKHWQPDPPVGEDVVDQLIRGIEAEGTSLGMIVTSGVISEAAYSASEKYFEKSGIRIELIDGEQFSKLIVEYGVRGA